MLKIAVGVIVFCLVRLSCPWRVRIESQVKRLIFILRRCSHGRAQTAKKKDVERTRTNEPSDRVSCMDTREGGGRTLTSYLA
jgi:hypothetical protein